jgi:hypothetical protein
VMGHAAKSDTTNNMVRKDDIYLEITPKARRPARKAIV